jgi:hypothetical protein
MAKLNFDKARHDKRYMGLSDKAHAIFMAILLCTPKGQNVCRPKISTLMLLSRISSRATYYKYYEELLKSGLITKNKYQTMVNAMGTWIPIKFVVNIIDKEYIDSTPSEAKSGLHKKDTEYVMQVLPSSDGKTPSYGSNSILDQNKSDRRVGFRDVQWPTPAYLINPPIGDLQHLAWVLRDCKFSIEDLKKLLFELYSYINNYNIRVDNYFAGAVKWIRGIRNGNLEPWLTGIVHADGTLNLSLNNIDTYA